MTSSPVIVTLGTWYTIKYDSPNTEEYTVYGTYDDLNYAKAQLRVLQKSGNPWKEEPYVLEEIPVIIFPGNVAYPRVEPPLQLTEENSEVHMLMRAAASATKQSLAVKQMQENISALIVKSQQGEPLTTQDLALLTT